METSGNVAHEGHGSSRRSSSVALARPRGDKTGAVCRDHWPELWDTVSGRMVRGRAVDRAVQGIGAARELTDKQHQSSPGRRTILEIRLQTRKSWHLMQPCPTLISIPNNLVTDITNRDRVVCDDVLSGFGAVVMERAVTICDAIIREEVFNTNLP